MGTVIYKYCRLQQGTACTEFQIEHSGDVFVGKNFDWIAGDGLFCVNKRGVSKKAIPTFIDKKIFLFSIYLVPGIPPVIDDNYRTIPSREARGAQGFSRGGRGALKCALMTAQYSIDMKPSGFLVSNADVNRDGRISITDALILVNPL